MYIFEHVHTTYISGWRGSEPDLEGANGSSGSLDVVRPGRWAIEIDGLAMKNGDFMVV